jgi:hypothetical protein
MVIKMQSVFFRLNYSVLYKKKSNAPYNLIKTILKIPNKTG